MEELKDLPFSFQKKYSGKCACCETIREETITYRLYVDFLEHTGMDNVHYKTYRIYYEPKYYVTFEKSPRIIGEHLGMGETDIKELVKKLLPLTQ